MRRYAQAVGELHMLVRGSATKTLTFGPLTVHTLKASSWSYPFLLIREIRRIVQMQHIEVVTAQDSFEIGWAAYLGTRGTKARVQVQIHTDLYSPWFARTSLKNRIRVLLADGLIERVDGIRVVSRRIANSITQRFKENLPLLSILPIYVPTLTIEQSAQAKPYPFVFLLACRLEQEKRIEDAITAFAQIAPQLPQAGLVIAGTGSRKQKLVTLASAKGLSQKVTFMGWSSMEQCLALADVFVQTSAYEGYGVSLLEAAQARKPIITTNVGVVGELFNDGREALVVPVGDPKALAAAMKRLAEDSALCESLGHVAGEVARGHLRLMEGQAEALACDLRSVLEGSKQV